MLRSPLPLLLALALLPAVGRAEPAPGEVEVEAVRFQLARPVARPTEAWLEAAVELNARPAADSPGKMLSRVRVTLWLGVEVLAGPGPKRFEFLRASAEAVALGNGHAVVRFYVPPEIVRRDGARGEPRFWSAAATVGGRPMPAARARFSSGLATAEARRGFAEKAAAAAPANDGFLQPQYLTPFVEEYPNATPTFVRRESAG